MQRRVDNTVVVTEKLKRLPILCELGISKVEPLTPDASDRRYFRIFTEKKIYGESVIAMCLKEKVDGDLPFLNIQEYLLKHGFSVPIVHLYDPSLGILILEDFGGVSLEEYIEGKSEYEIISIYRKAINICLDFEFKCMQEKSCQAFSMEFDFSKLMWEFDFFVEHMIAGLRKVKISTSEREKLRTLFMPVVNLLLKEPKVFTHRDFHSRNLMVKEEELCIIDFQDARLGLCQYDLVSLLRDSYVVLSDSTVQELLEYYFDEKEKKGQPVSDKTNFIKVFDYMAIQRNIKAIGTFSFQAEVKENTKYKKWILPTLGYVNNNLAKYPELEKFAVNLSGFLEGAG